MDSNRGAIGVRANWVLRGLWATAVLLVIAGVSMSWLAHYRGHDWMFGFAPKIDLGNEANFPTYFSSLLLLFSSALLAAIALHASHSSRIFTRHWWALSAIFGILSMDEIVGLHELAVGPLRNAFRLTGVFYFAWVIPGAIFVAIFSVVFMRFLFHLPRRCRLRIAIAGIVYVGGALGVELIGGNYVYHHGDESFAYSMVVAVEESMEMTGAILFIGALFGIIEDRMMSIEFKLAS